MSRQRERLDNSTKSFAFSEIIGRRPQVVYSRYVLPQPKICAKFCQSPTVAAGACAVGNRAVTVAHQPAAAAAAPVIQPPVSRSAQRPAASLAAGVARRRPQRVSRRRRALDCRSPSVFVLLRKIPRPAESTENPLYGSGSNRSPSVPVRRLAAGSPCWQPCGRGDGAPIRPPQRQLPSRRRKGQLRQQAAKPWAPRR